MGSDWIDGEAMSYGLYAYTDGQNNLHQNI